MSSEGVFIIHFPSSLVSPFVVIEIPPPPFFFPCHSIFSIVIHVSFLFFFFFSLLNSLVES